MSNNQVLCFTAWLLKRGLCSASISAYLSGLRILHLVKGIDQPVLRPAIVAAVIEGKSHIETLRTRLGNKAKRLPVTLKVLKLLKATINEWNQSNQMRLLVWSVSLICFFGGFRIHDILSRTSMTYDPAFTLLNKNIKVEKIRTKEGMISVLQILIKSPKEDRVGRDFIINVYETQGEFCSVKYYQRWRQTNPPASTNGPAFVKPDGKAFTGKDFNQILKHLLSPHIDYKKQKICTHSFRSGMATLLGQIGFSDEDIQAMGRWSSRAFEGFLKMPRTKRAAMAQKLSRFCV